MRATVGQESTRRNNTIGEYTTSGKTVNADLITGLPSSRDIAVARAVYLVTGWNRLCPYRRLRVSAPQMVSVIGLIDVA